MTSDKTPEKKPTDKAKPESKERGERTGAFPSPFAPVRVGGLTDDELIEIALGAIIELKSRLKAKTTREIAVDELPKTFVEGEAEEFTRLPAKSPKTPDEAKATTWRITLLSSNPSHKPLGLEIFDEVTIGRKSEDGGVDIDLTNYDGVALGVSRNHARLRPTKSGLVLVDLGSTNGTFHNGVKVKPGVLQEVDDNDTLVFGKLAFKLKIISRPEHPEK
jgi:hypothetical protein